MAMPASHNFRMLHGMILVAEAAACLSLRLTTKRTGTATRLYPAPGRQGQSHNCHFAMLSDLSFRSLHTIRAAVDPT